MPLVLRKFRERLLPVLPGFRSDRSCARRRPVAQVLVQPGVDRSTFASGLRTHEHIGGYEDRRSGEDGQVERIAGPCVDACRRPLSLSDDYRVIGRLHQTLDPYLANATV